MNHVQLVRHPLIDHSLAVLRSRTTSAIDFRWHAGVVSKILLVEALRNIKTQTCRIRTPLAFTQGQVVADKIVVVPVLRAGLAMLFASQDLISGAAVGFIGLERDEKTAIARKYYQKIPHLNAQHHVLVLDPMLATGGSFDDTVQAVRELGGRRIICISIVSSRQGLRFVQKRHPEVKIITAAIDAKLNSRKFIVPGLGDFGDRYFDG